MARKPPARRSPPKSPPQSKSRARSHARTGGDLALWAPPVLAEYEPPPRRARRVRVGGDSAGRRSPAPPYAAVVAGAIGGVVEGLLRQFGVSPMVQTASKVAEPIVGAVIYAMTGPASARDSAGKHIARAMGVGMMAGGARNLSEEGIALVAGIAKGNKT